MIRCLVTDRRQLAGRSDSFRRQCALLLDLIRAAVADGVDLVQIRERDLAAVDLAAIVAAAVAAARGSSTRILVNDRIDVALSCRADGVHLRGDSVAPSDARRITSAGFLISRAVHRSQEAAAAGGADYVIAGTVFRTRSKPDVSRLLGLDGLRAIVEASPVPVLAIGGVTRDRIGDILSAGAAGVAGIGLFLPAAQRFDRPTTHP
jgi:thiamine-phosphate diphosphorylase